MTEPISTEGPQDNSSDSGPREPAWVVAANDGTYSEIIDARQQEVEGDWRTVLSDPDVSGKQPDRMLGTRAGFTAAQVEEGLQQQATPEVSSMESERAQISEMEDELGDALINLSPEEKDILGRSQLTATDTWSDGDRDALKEVLAQLPDEARETISARHGRINELYAQRMAVLHPAALAPQRVREMALEDARNAYMQELNDKRDADGIEAKLQQQAAEQDASEAEGKRRVDALRARNEEANRGFRRVPTAEGLEQTKRGMQKLRDAENGDKTAEEMAALREEFRVFNELFDSLRADPSNRDLTDPELRIIAREMMDGMLVDVSQGGTSNEPSVGASPAPVGDTPPTSEPDDAESRLPAPLRSVGRRLQALGRRIFTREALAKTITMVGGVALAPELATGVAWGIGAFVLYKAAKTGYNAATVIQDKGLRATLEQAGKEIGEKWNAAKNGFARAFKTFWEPQSYEGRKRGGRFLLNRAMRGSALVLGVPLGLATAAAVELPQGAAAKAAAFVGGVTEAGLAAHAAGFVPRRVVDGLDWLMNKDKERREEANQSEPEYEPGTLFRQVMSDTAAVASATAFVAELFGVMDNWGQKEVEEQVVKEEPVEEEPIAPVVEEPEEPVVEDVPVVEEPGEPYTVYDMEIPVDSGVGEVMHDVEVELVDGEYLVKTHGAGIGLGGQFQAMQRLAQHAQGQEMTEIVGEWGKSAEKFDKVIQQIYAKDLSLAELEGLLGTENAAAWASQNGFGSTADFVKALNEWRNIDLVTPMKVFQEGLQPA